MASAASAAAAPGDEPTGRLREPVALEDSWLDLEGALGIRAANSSWVGDYGAAGGLKLGVRIAHQFGFYALTRLGVHAVDDRLVTFLSIGTQYWPFPEWS